METPDFISFDSLASLSQMLRDDFPPGPYCAGGTLSMEPLTVYRREETPAGAEWKKFMSFVSAEQAETYAVLLTMGPGLISWARRGFFLNEMAQPIEKGDTRLILVAVPYKVEGELAEKKLSLAEAIDFVMMNPEAVAAGALAGGIDPNAGVLRLTPLETETRSILEAITTFPGGGQSENWHEQHAAWFAKAWVALRDRARAALARVMVAPPPGAN